MRAACAEATRLTLPSWNRTCGFPASGSPDNSRHRHSQAVARSHLLQIDQAQLIQLLVVADSLRRSVGSLAAPSQVVHETVSCVPVDRPECLARVAVLEVVPPSPQLLVEFPDQDWDGFEAHAGAGSLPQFCLFPLDRLLRRSHVQVAPIPALPVPVIPERVSEKVQ